MLKKLAFGGLGLVFLASILVATPVMATTDPIAELRIRIAELQEQLAKLMAQSNSNIGHGAQGEPDYCHMPFAHNLMIGSTDARTDGEVTRLQQFLQSQGYTEAQVTGYYGHITAGLVMRWQKAHGMGFVTLKSGVGPMTRGKIHEACSPTLSKSITVTSPQPGELVNLPITVRGYVKAGWIYEGYTGTATVIDANGKTISSAEPIKITSAPDVFPAAFEVVVGDRQMITYVQTDTGFVVLSPDGGGGIDYRVPVRFDRPANKSSALCPTYDSKPVISSITPSSGPVGTTIEIQGCNFLGFEGDKILWFTNSGGVKGVIHGESDAGTRTLNTVMRVTLPQTLCQSDNSYSGLPCSASLNFVPGTYTIYSNSWGGNSNAVNFTVTGR
ncbi:hypothetical protein A3A42_04710 [Candidatus Kaiserbacteria bacterium RIFCSPLOWO2_01_FULL_55_25]|nr:MAG: hypothetical protein A3A42_04710 [Candidatus Kaiserbacteria bacterium RIFCSPLOWO2_01_FULL_55_25]